VKTLSHLACEDKWIDDTSNRNDYAGIEAICTLKGDVDNLGSIFQDDQAAASFARMASLSRQMNNFFAVYLPWLCQTKWKNTYTVFAGGDDFFLIGSWRSQLRLAEEMRTAFSRYVANNPAIHFSAGLYITKPGTPVSYLGVETETALEAAKSFDNGARQKDAVCCFGKVMSWKQYADLLIEFEKLQQLRAEPAVGRISTSYWYDILQLADLSAQSHVDPKANIWRARLGYRTVRAFKDKRLHQPAS
jgi:CRISPR-associated protein Csm1